MSTFADYAKKANSAMGVSRNIARVTDLFEKKMHVMGADALPAAAPGAPTTALVPAKKESSVTDFVRSVGVTERDIHDDWKTVAGMAVGGFLMRKDHPVLGIIGGASLARNLPALMNAEQRPVALRNLTTTGGGVAGSLIWDKHPFWGFVVGDLVGGIVAHLVGFHG